MDLTIAAGIIGGIGIGIGLMIKIFKGIFITKPDCNDRHKNSDNKFDKLDNKVDKVHDRLSDTGKWIVALATKADIKDSDLPKL